MSHDKLSMFQRPLHGAIKVNYGSSTLCFILTILCMEYNRTYLCKFMYFKHIKIIRACINMLYRFIEIYAYAKYIIYSSIEL